MESTHKNRCDIQCCWRRGFAGLTALTNGDRTRPTRRDGAQLNMNVDVMNNERDIL
jgi:hypothetical protein